MAFSFMACCTVAPLAEVLETAVITGVLASQPQAMDVKIEQFSMSVYGKEFIKDQFGSMSLPCCHFIVSMAACNVFPRLQGQI